MRFLVRFVCCSLMAAQGWVPVASAQPRIHEVVTPAGSAEFGHRVLMLPNGNFVVADPGFDDGVLADAGAVHLHGTDLSRIATLTGSTPGDRIGADTLHSPPFGSFPNVIALPGGDYVVQSPQWDLP